MRANGLICSDDLCCNIIKTLKEAKDGKACATVSVMGGEFRIMVEEDYRTRLAMAVSVAYECGAAMLERRDGSIQLITRKDVLQAMDEFDKKKE